MILMLMQGIPGSGKSTVANKWLALLGEDAKVFSTDEFWGEDYDYDPDKAAFAHRWNQDRVWWAMLHKTPVIIVDNTNLTNDAIRPYRKMAEPFDYEVIIYRVDVPLETCLERNAQRPPNRMIPESVVREMYDKLQEFVIR